MDLVLSLCAGLFLHLSDDDRADFRPFSFPLKVSEWMAFILNGALAAHDASLEEHRRHLC